MKKQKSVSQIVHVQRVKENKKTNRKAHTLDARTFENRFISRYKKMPEIPQGLPEPTFSQSSNKILQERYLLKGGNLETIETVAERFWHIAYDIASGDFDFGSSEKEVYEKAKEFYSVMVRQEFLPNSPTIMNAGKKNGLQYSACFVLPIGDSLPEIFDSVKYAALIHQTGGGTGFSFSRLRPAGSVVNTTGGVASGPVSFLRVFNAATESIKQGGTRRGANMGVLRVDHPDVMEFIRCKAVLDDLNKPVYESIAPLLPDDIVRSYLKTLLLDKQISNFNISVAITNKFMEALEKGEDYELVEPGSEKITGRLHAKEVFDEIVERAWNTGDPGLIFIDRINNSSANPVPSLETIESTNPCVTGDTLITTDEGQLPIKEIVEREGQRNGRNISLIIDKRALDLNDNGTMLSQASKFYDVGVRGVFKLITNSGLELKATEDHRVLTLYGWVKMKDLKTGDKVLTRSDKLKNQFIDFVESVEKYGKERVYDLYEPISHSVIANGLIVHQCGEQPLAPWDACNLGSINLGKFVLPDGSGVDWEGLKKVTHQAVHFLDNVVQTNPYTLEPIYNEVKKNRRIGLGVMGWADMLFKLKISYNTQQAVDLARKVMRFINEEGHMKSQELAKVRGPFPNWPYSIYAKKEPIRNSTITTIAPTGTISIIGDCSSGIEPVFALAYIHRAKGAGDSVRTLIIANKTFTEIAQREKFYSDDLARKVMEHGSVLGVDVVPAEWQKVFITAPEIEPVWHVKMQAAFQNYTDNGVSKTINLPNSATRDDVKNAYLLAWQTGCNGITIYRDGSKATQVLNVSNNLKQEAAQESQDTVVSRPMILRGRTYKVQTPVGEAFITINRDEKDQPFEVFVTVGKGGMHTMADAEAMGRLVSLSLRVARTGNVVDAKSVALKIAQQLRGIGGSFHVGFGKNRVMSLADAIAKVLAEDLAQSFPAEVETIPLNLTSDQQLRPEDDQPLAGNIQADLCPECGSVSFVFEEGCKKCHSCGYSMC